MGKWILLKKGLLKFSSWLDSGGYTSLDLLKWKTEVVGALGKSIQCSCVACSCTDKDRTRKIS